MAEASDSRRAAGSGGSPAAGLADRLGLAAAPVFAVMALLTQAAASGQPEILCLSSHPALPIDGMALMYLLMAAFHLSPWLRLLSRRA